MENAVKAMYMVAAMLIAVMIMGLFIYLFRTGSLFGTNYELKKQQEQIDQFNSKFEPYAREVEGTSGAGGTLYAGNTIFDIITVANLAFDINERNYNDNKNRVEIQVNGIPGNDPISIGIIHGTDRNGQYDELSNILKKNRFFVGAIPLENESSRDTILMDDLLIKNDGGASGAEKKLTDAVLNTVNDNNIPYNRTVYRYYFNCTNISYSEQSGKVNKMEFELEQNTGYDALVSAMNPVPPI